MGIRRSAEEAGRQLRLAADEARWSALDAAWTVEERVLWSGSDAARKALRRALDAVEPLQRLIQTRLAWPLADRLDDYGAAGRTAVATVAVAAAAAAGIAGLQLATTEGASQPPAEGAVAAAVAEPAPDSSATLSGVAPDFERTASANGVAAPTATPAAAAAPKAPPAQVAWTFAQAFVSYEVGKADEQTATTFAEVADEPLAKALGEEPPRLPESGEVPEAKVLNVVLGKRKGEELEASVSLVRLRAASELRLTLRRGEEGWRVAEVRG